MDEKHSGGHGPMNTIRAGRYELNRLLDAMDAKGAKNTVDREFMRWGYRQQSVTVELRHPGGTIVRLPVATRNLSNSGIAVLHNSFVHTGSGCAVTLEHQTMGKIKIEGEVTRCQHIGGTVHEIGIRFEQGIDTREYMRLDLLSEAFSLESVAPEKLEGAIVYIDDSELDLKLVGKLLEPTFLSIQSTSDPDEGVELAQRGCDLVMCELRVGETSGVDLIKRMREGGVRAPVLMVTADTSAHARDKLRSGGADALVSKPLTSEKLLRAIAEFMISGADAGPLISTLTKDDPSLAFVAGFIGGLGAQLSAIEAAVREEDTEECRQICMRLASSAPPLGFEPIGVIATRVLEELGKGVEIADVHNDLQTLFKTCRRARGIIPSADTESKTEGQTQTQGEPQADAA